MGLRGPAPTPSALRVIQGKKPNPTEPQPARVKPEPPDWLDETARKEWARVVDALFEIGLVNKADETALATYCQVYSRMVECERILSKEGLTMEGRWGTTLRPEVGASQKYAGLVKTYCLEFGLSPAGRARMALPIKDEDDEDDGGLD